MSRKDRRKSIAICPNRAVWNGLKAKKQRSLGETAERLIRDTDWLVITPGVPARGARLAVQLPLETLVPLMAAAKDKGASEESMILGALEAVLST